MEPRETIEIIERLKKRLPPESRIQVSFWIETDMKERARKAARALAEEVGGKVYGGEHLFRVCTDQEHVANICWTVKQEVSADGEWLDSVAAPRP